MGRALHRLLIGALPALLMLSAGGLNEAAAVAEFCRKAPDRCSDATDGGSGGGTSSGGGTGVNTGGGSGGGASTGGGAGGGTAAPWTFGQASVTGPNTASTGGIIALSGTANDVWALQDNGALYHSTGGPFTQWVKVGSGGFGLYTSGQFKAFTDTYTIYTCTGACTNASDFAAYTDPGQRQPRRSMAGLCGSSPNDVYAVGNADSGGQYGILYRWNGTQWSVLNAMLPMADASNCAVAPNGAVFISGEDGVVRYEGGTTFYERITNELTAIRFFGIAVVGGETLASGRKMRLYRRTGTGTWLELNAVDELSATLYAVAGFSTDVRFAAGKAGLSSEQNWYEWNGGTWRNGLDELPGLPRQETVMSILVTDAKTVYFGGVASYTAVIVRGTRP